MTLEDLLQHLDGVSGGPNQYTAICPAHEDDSPSLSVTASPGSSAILVNCHAGCSFEEISGSLGLEKGDFFLDSGQENPPDPQAGVTLKSLSKHTGIAKEELAGFLLSDGVLRNRPAVEMRYNAKDGGYIRSQWRTSLRNGGPIPRFLWDNKGGGAQPYGLWRFKEARRVNAIVLVEGQSDAWSLWSVGVPALGFPGADTPKKLLEPSLLEDVTRVWVCGDNDEAGEAFVKAVGKKLPRVKLRVFSARFPHGDLNDWYKAVGKERFSQEVRTAMADAVDLHREMVEKEESERKSGSEIYTLKDLLKDKSKAPEDIIERMIPRGVTLFTGNPKTGKSFLAADAALARCRGERMLEKYKSPQKGAVLFLDLEQDKFMARARWQGVVASPAGAPDGLYITHEWPRMGYGGIERLDKWLTENPGGLVIIDILSLFMPVSSSSYGGMNAYHAEVEIMNQISSLAKSHNAGIMLVHHHNKFANPQDPLGCISGTNALAGRSDALWLLFRDRETSEAKLLVTGKSVPEQWIELDFNPLFGGWSIKNDGPDPWDIGNDKGDD